MTVNDASLGDSGSKLSKVAATSLLMGVTRGSSEAYGLVDNSQILTTQVHYFSDVPKDLVDNLGKMGMDNSSILNDQEGQYLNFIYKTEAQRINLAGKKVAFLGSKVDYFESTRKDSLVVGGSNLYLFNTMQKTESGGYDAAVTYCK